FALFFLPVMLITAFNFLVLADENILSSIILMISILIIIILSLITVNRIVKDMFMNKNMQLYLTFLVRAVDILRAKLIILLCTGILPVMVVAGAIVGGAAAFSWLWWTRLIPRAVTFC